MAYNVEKLAKLGALKELGLKQKAVDEAQNKRIKALEDVGAQANVLEGVKVNGVALAIAEKMVDILVATGSKNGSISVAGTDVAIKGLAALAYKAKISQSDLDDALSAALAAGRVNIHSHAICRRQTIHLDVDVLRIPGDAGIGLPAGDRDGERNECCPVCFQSVHFFQCSSGGRCDFGGSIAGLGCSAAELIQSCERIAQRSHLP